MERDLLSPVELIYAIKNLESGGWNDSETIQSITSAAEESARKVLTREGYHPHFEEFGYIADDPELTPAENRKMRLEFESMEWVNEAGHAEGHPDPEIDAAAITILEASRLRDYIEFGQMEKAVISMANMLACSLLHLDQRKDELTTKLGKLTTDLSNRFDEIKPDAELGKSTRKNQQAFAQKRGKQQTEERSQKWEKWQECADIIKAEKSHIKSKSDLARLVKQRLKLTDSIETIRHRISW
ncbi:hypothetical protein [Methylomonas rapida]|uniref:Uncharacterized protein n=1 Tax=Methylomonas rapida TaxID=2963939 RepID=A0ABY7GK64_9GAMM|nr:hypothetical protein [Methylomonas rapida]WAR44038.1 hypothetical protein NM686_016920 [Methylomonas rapida]